MPSKPCQLALPGFIELVGGVPGDGKFSRKGTEHRPCKNCRRMICFVTLKGRRIPFESDGSGVHICPSRQKRNPKVFRENFPNSARCGCINTLGVPIEGGEIRFSRVEWPWEKHKCPRTLESLDGGVDLLAKYCAEFDPRPQPVLSLVAGICKISRDRKPLFLIAIQTVTSEKHCGVVEADRGPQAGSLVAWCARGRRMGILTSSNSWFDWLLDGCPASKLGLDNWI